jgi:hypothetical protein
LRQWFAVIAKSESDPDAYPDADAVPNPNPWGGVVGGAHD